ncbi:DHHA1 domain-containing protein [Methanocella arvoryzae]|uniref:Single-stranded DNA-specific exonuclease (RecJ-like) n=1 Tax=Methanocella arvoryzae (strain DSM 22066 / NBRC 105507 / MRE50) TaxID=351160 RepID=Q0W937_METAR|nr:DHH family phosphoesterase [Methanocella arvoryzae]CAJ35089.1 putative single-stranded DNA-specific exonuclease (RecJ-like) [Methanocella arvoryzae MRE50]
MLDAISQMARPAADKIFKTPFIRVVSHHDADGITACGIICHALLRRKVHFQATIVSNLDPSIEAILDPAVPVIFCDMGSGQPDIVNKYDAIILDHHVPVGEHKNIQVNPHLIGIDGGSELSGSGVAYALARIMGDNVDLAGLAISGAIGDKQKMAGPNKDILDEAIKNGVITIQKGLKLGMGPLEKVLEYSIDPYFSFSGKQKETEEFLKEMGLSGNIEALSQDDLKRLGSALSLLLLKKSPPDSVDALFGDIYILNKELIKDVYDFTNTVNSCGKMGTPGLGLEVCLRHEASLREAEEKRFSYARQILDALHDAVGRVKDMGWIRYIDIQSSDVTGAIASTVIRYILPDKPLIVLNTEDGKVKVSARGTPQQIKQGLDLSAALRESAGIAGGSGGGHKIASGAAIPVGRQPEFLERLNTIVGRQISGQV